MKTANKVGGRCAGYLEVSVWRCLQPFVDCLLQHLQAVLQFLLEVLEQQVAGQQHLMVCECVRVVLTTLTIHLQGRNSGQQRCVLSCRQW